MLKPRAFYSSSALRDRILDVVVVQEEIESLRRDFQALRLTRDEMKREIRRLLFKHHPDRNASDRRAAEERTRAILDWYRAFDETPDVIPPFPDDGEEAAAETSHAPPPLAQFVVFMVEGEIFACDVKWVLGVRNVRDLRRPDGALPRWIHDRVGIFTLDAARRPAGPVGPYDTTQALLLRVGSSFKAFVVDRVDGVRSVPDDGFASSEGVRSFTHSQGTATIVSPAFFGL